VTGEGAGYGSGVLLTDFESLASTIYRMDPTTGTIQRVAGNGFFGVDGEGIPATDAYLRARDVAVAADGTRRASESRRSASGG